MHWARYKSYRKTELLNHFSLLQSKAGQRFLSTFMFWKWLLTNNISILLSNLLKSFWIPNMSKYAQSPPSVNIMAVLTNSDPAYRKAPPFIVDIWNFPASVKAETRIRRRDFRDWGRNKDCLDFSLIFSLPAGREFPATSPGRSESQSKYHHLLDLTLLSHTERSTLSRIR